MTMLNDYVPLIKNYFDFRKILLLLTIVSCPVVSYIFYKLLIFNKSIKNILIYNVVLLNIILIYILCPIDWQVYNKNTIK